MRNLVLLMVLLAGLVTGYFVGDYRGRDARRTLDDAIQAGKELDEKRRQEIAQLKGDLEVINRKYETDIAALRKQYEASKVEWEAAKAGLDETIKRQKTKATELSVTIAHLQLELGKVSPEERKRLEQEIARLQKELDETQRQLEGNVCLKTQVPTSVLNALRGVGMGGK